MTAAAYKRQLDSAPAPESPTLRHGAVRVYFLAVAFAACQLAGIAALVRAYDIAQTTLSSTSEFAWFWAGMLLLQLPIAGLIARRATDRNLRTALLILYGLVSYAPKLLRNPASPAFHDEYAHWRATFEILATGRLFEPNPVIQMIARYPGLHAATAAVVNITGLTIWQAAALLVILFHVALVLGIAALTRALGFDSRTAALAAILYSLNSSFLYFDTQYAYESMAITLAVWALVAYVRAIRSPAREGRAAWAMLTVVLVAATVITHHLSAFTLIVIMALVSIAMSIPWLARGDGWVRSAVVAWSLTLVSGLMAAAWLHYVAPKTLSYLSPFAGQGLSELLQVLNGSGSARQLFGASLSPWWEQKSAYMVPVLALALTAAALILMWTGIKDGRLPLGRRRALLGAFSFLAFVYFPSTVFILAPSGAEGARRSWAFTWIGLSILASLAAVWLIDWAGRRSLLWSRAVVRLGLCGALAVALVGGTAAGLIASYRFPGPFLYGSDARSVTPELLAASRWFLARFGAGNNIVTDRYTGLIFGSFDLQTPAAPSAGFPVYNVYLAKPGAPIEPAYLIPDLGLSDYTYLIVDARMAYDAPELGVYFTSNDPASVRPRDSRSPFFGRLTKFNRTQWMVKVYQSENYAIYRLNLPPPAAKAGYQQRPPTSAGKHRRRGRVVQGKLMVTP